MKRYQCGDFGVPGRRPWGPPGCCPPACPPPCQPTCPPVMPEPCPPQPCPPQNPCVSGCVPTPWVLGGCYQAGQLVTYNGYLYVANVDNAAGVPGESADFTLLSTPRGPPALSDSPAHPAKPGSPGQRGPRVPRKPKQMDNDPEKRGKLGRIWCAFDAEHPVQYTNCVSVLYHGWSRIFWWMTGRWYR